MSEGSIDPTEARVAVLLAIARDFGTGIPVDELLWLMAGANDPTDGPGVERWIRDRPKLATLLDGVAYARGHDRLRRSPDRAERARRFVESARSFTKGALTPVLPWVRCLAVTGSVAYGEPEEGDDLDLMVIVREGALWAFLAYTYLAVRWKAPRHPGAPSTWCFNFVLEDRVAEREFPTSRGLLVAREALLAQPLAGEDYYRGLLRSCPWLGTELPRLYTRWLEGPDAPQAAQAPRSGRAPLAVRALNAAIFLPLAAYLQAQGLRRNHRLLREGREEERFRTRTSLGRLALVSDRYERLMGAYARGRAPSPAAAAT